MQFAKRMGYRKIGIANCISFVDHAYGAFGHPGEPWFRGRVHSLQEWQYSQGGNRHPGERKNPSGNFEALCNPVAQAEMLNAHGCEFNVVMGLCVGHDSLFFKHPAGLCTVLVAKDRVLGHNPIVALHLADSYYGRVWGPDRPAQPPKLPVPGRRKNA